MEHHDDDFLRRAGEAQARVAQMLCDAVDVQLAAGTAALDVRTSQEHAQGSLAGALNVPLDLLHEQIASVLPDKEAPIVCFCNGGNRGALAAAALLDLGYTHVSSIEGGLRAYTAHRP